MTEWRHGSRVTVWTVVRLSAAILFTAAMLFPYRFKEEWWLFSSVSLLDPVLLLAAFMVFLSIAARAFVFTGEHRIFSILLLPLLFAVGSLSWSVDMPATMKSIVVVGSAVAAYLSVVVLFRGVATSDLLKGILVVVWILLITGMASYLPGSPLAPELLHSEREGSGFILSYRARFSHPFLGLSNSFATILVMLLPFVYAARRLGVWPKRAFWTGMILVAGIVATGSRGVLLAMVVVYGLLWLYRAWAVGTFPRGVLGGGLVVLGVAAGFLWLSPDAADHLGGRLSAANVDGRFSAFLAALQVATQDYPMGIGSGVSLSDLSDVSLRSVHNAYLQNVLWFGVVGGIALSIAMWLLPWLVLRIKVSTVQALIAKRALATSLLLLMVVNLSQASWEGSVLRVQIYVIVALGVLLIRQCDEVRPGLRRG